MCDVESLKFSSITAQLNRRLRDDGERKTVKAFLGDDKPTAQIANKQVESLVPSI